MSVVVAGRVLRWQVEKLNHGSCMAQQYCKGCFTYFNSFMCTLCLVYDSHTGLGTRCKVGHEVHADQMCAHPSAPCSSALEQYAFRRASMSGQTRSCSSLSFRSSSALRFTIQDSSLSLNCQACVEGWVLVSKEGRITLLGGLDVGQAHRFFS